MSAVRWKAGQDREDPDLPEMQGGAVMKLGEVARLIGVTPSRCWRKQKYKSKGAADAHLRALRRANYVQGEAQLNSFLCRGCGCYHVGHAGVVPDDGKRGA